MNKFVLLITCLAVRRARKFLLFLFLFVLFLLTYHPITQSPNNPITYLYAVENLNLTETKLATIPEDYQEVSKIVFSANGKRVAYKAQKKSKEFVVVGSPAGEKAGKPYDRVAKEPPFILISPDGQRVVYQARRGEKEYLVFASPPPACNCSLFR